MIGGVVGAVTVGSGAAARRQVNRTVPKPALISA